MVDALPKSDVRVDQGEALLRAVKDDRKSDLDRLIEQGADPAYRGKRGQTALHDAAVMGRAYCLMELLRVVPDLVAAKDNAGQTAIHCAAAEGHHSCLNELLGIGRVSREVPLEVVTAKTFKHGWTALHYAAHNGHAECCRALMVATGQAPELVGALNLTGRTAVHLASQRGHAKCLDVLLKTHMAKQLLMTQSLDGHTAMHIAARFGRRGCVNSLARRLPDLVKVKNHSSHPSLHEAARRGNESCVDALLALGGAAELSATSKQYAKSRGHGEIAEALIQMEKRLKAQKTMKRSRSMPNTF
mmetsp:Transcript_21544/g.40542  ORF Transcript_21544/g.40542 Transcript_21544/m.40542 type:complete len:302 (+) Transcript_21544:51-956(+)